jgi:DNA-binding MarR family transcriptional regulator/ribosomal protein S18 acetylase RimI-like enzyme
MSDFLASLGPLGFTYRLGRLSDRLQDGGRRLYDSMSVPLEPSWHVLLLYLEHHAGASISEVATALQVSHPAVSELARRMETAGLITASDDPRDGRRRVLRLSPRARRLMPEFRAIWSAAAHELEAVIEATTGSDALAGLAIIEGELDDRDLDVRIAQRLASERVVQRRFEPTPAIHIRPLLDSDRQAVIHIARELVRTADTYAYDAAIDDDGLWRYWCPSAPGAGFAAVARDEVVGMFVIRPNNPGPGAHVANASYAVRADMRGMGIGRRMGEESLRIAADLGYRAMQFNTVVATNTNAIRLWRSLGFRIVGTIPGGFSLPDGRAVPHHIMFRSLP